MNTLSTVELENGLKFEMFDRSNRYFGDYHRIKIDIECSIPLEARFFNDDDSNESLVRARKLYGDSLMFERSLERMGVAGADVEATKQEMVETFLSSSREYLQHPEFVMRYVARMLEKRTNPAGLPR